MRICCFFSIFKEDNVELVYKSIASSQFYSKNKQCEFLFACSKNDEDNIKKLKTLKKKNEKINFFVLEDNAFNIKKAFQTAIDEIDCDVLLMGDSKIAKNDLIFLKCLEKYDKGANVVHVKKKRKGFTGFFHKIAEKIYSFFANIFTSKRDWCNILSLGLYDKNFIDLLKELPQKSCFLKNTKDLYGFVFRTIYINEKTKTTQMVDKQNSSKKMIFISSILFVCFLAFFVILNVVTGVSIVFNLIFIVVLIILFVLVVFSIPKFYFEKRNMN